MNPIEEEYTSGVETLGFSGMVYYKFLSMFQVKGGTISFGVVAPAEIDPEVASTLRSYIKLQKEWLRAEKRTNRTEMRQRIWWVVQKVLDYKLFKEREQCYMMYWLDKCDDQLID